MMVAALMDIMIDVTIVTAALPMIGHGLGAFATRLEWGVN
jgi:hypothetical protein